MLVLIGLMLISSILNGFNLMPDWQFYISCLCALIYIEADFIGKLIRGTEE